VTIIAIIAAINMSRVFADRRDAVVTRAAGPNYLRVVDRNRGRKHSSVVAVFADNRCLYVRQTLADSGCSVVTTNAIVDNTGMIEQGREPTSCIVTVVALIT